MREILFRGKTKDGGAWVKGGLISVDDEEHGTVTAIIPHNCEAYRFNISGEYVDPETVGQFTGLTDKNGKKIFEGDILRKKYYPEDDVIIEWFDGRFQFRERNKPVNYGYSSVVCNQNAVERLKIIGNVHDNPELLEV